jgi:MYXO-CTERM domain-containing protein
VAPAPAPAGEPQAAVDPDAAARAASGDDELAVGAPGSPGGPSLDEPDNASSTGSIVAFAAALVAVGGVGLVLRRRRATVA